MTKRLLLLIAKTVMSWSYTMKAAGGTAPITVSDDKQYLAVISTGEYHNYSKKYGELYVGLKSN